MARAAWVTSARAASASLTAMFLVLWARHRRRKEAEMDASTARINPVPPSVTTKSGSLRPHRPLSSRNSTAHSVDSLLPGARCTRTFPPR